MDRRYKPDEINLQINDWIPFVNERGSGVVIEWYSDIGFGEYTLYKRNGTEEWSADSELMDIDEDKAFIEELLKLLVERLNIRG